MVSFELPRELRARLDEAARFDGRTRATACRRAVSLYVETILNAKSPGGLANLEEVPEQIDLFVRERCTSEKGVVLSARALYQAYIEWCESRGEVVANQRRFGGMMRTHGCRRKRRAEGYVYADLTLRPERADR